MNSQASPTEHRFFFDSYYFSTFLSCSSITFIEFIKLSYQKIKRVTIRKNIILGNPSLHTYPKNNYVTPYFVFFVADWFNPYPQMYTLSSKTNLASRGHVFRKRDLTGKGHEQMIADQK